MKTDRQVISAIFVEEGAGMRYTIMRTVILGLALLIIGAVVPRPGQAVAICFAAISSPAPPVGTGDVPCPASLTQIGDPGPVGLAPDGRPAGTGFSGAIATAGAGQLGGRSQAEATLPLNDRIGFTLVGQESSNFTLMDLVVGGPLGSIVPISINLTVSGFAAVGSTTPGQMFAQASADIRSSFGGVGFLKIVDNPSRAEAQTGIFASFECCGAFALSGTTPTVNVLVGQTFVFFLALDTVALVTAPFGTPAGHAEAVMDLGNTVGFPLIGPVANLPAGFTLNSVDGLIVDNRFVGGAPPPPPAVPVPSSLLLFGIGLAGLGVLSKR